MLNFFHTIKSSIYNPDFYISIKTVSFSGTLKYFFGLALILAIINTLLLSYDLAVKVPKEVKEFISQTTSSLPDDIEINIDKGQVQTNKEEPLFIPFPKFDFETTPESFNNLLVVDTKTPFSATQFNQYKTLFWLTKDSLFYQSADFEQRSISLLEVKSFKIDRSLIESLVNKAEPWLNSLGPVLIIIVFIGIILGLTFNLIYFLFLAVFIFFLGGIFKWGLNYAASYKVAIYASTLSFLIDILISNTGIYTGFYGFPYLFTLTSLCIATINLQNIDKNS